MKVKLKFLLVLSLIIFFQHYVEANCSEQLGVRDSESSQDSELHSLADELQESCAGKIQCNEENLKTSLEKAWNARGLKAYAAISAVMIGSSSLAAVLSSLISSENPALSYFVASIISQITTLGVYVVGAPIWEPLQSKIRGKAYQLTGHHQELIEGGNFLEQQYFRTNKRLTLNEQMSRNVLRDYIKTVTQSLYDAKKAAADREQEYIAAQIAEVYVRLSFLYPDVDPTSLIILNAIHTAFTHYVEEPESYIPMVLAKIREFDPGFTNEEVIDLWLMSKAHRE